MVQVIVLHRGLICLGLVWVLLALLGIIEGVDLMLWCYALDCPLMDWIMDDLDWQQDDISLHLPSKVHDAVPTVRMLSRRLILFPTSDRFPPPRMTKIKKEEEKRQHR